MSKLRSCWCSSPPGRYCISIPCHGFHCRCVQSIGTQVIFFPLPFAIVMIFAIVVITNSRSRNKSHQIFDGRVAVPYNSWFPTLMASHGILYVRATESNDVVDFPTSPSRPIHKITVHDKEQVAFSFCCFRVCFFSLEYRCYYCRRCYYYCCDRRQCLLIYNKNSERLRTVVGVLQFQPINVCLGANGWDRRGDCRQSRSGRSRSRRGYRRVCHPTPPHTTAIPILLLSSPIMGCLVRIDLIVIIAVAVAVAVAVAIHASYAIFQ